MPEVKPICRFCKYADWPRNKAGARMISNCAGKCTFPIPLLPISIEGYRNEKVRKHYVSDTNRPCDTFEAIGK